MAESIGDEEMLGLDLGENKRAIKILKYLVHLHETKRNFRLEVVFVVANLYVLHFQR